jgi:hypothetical protein
MLPLFEWAALGDMSLSPYSESSCGFREVVQLWERRKATSAERHTPRPRGCIIPPESAATLAQRAPSACATHASRLYRFWDAALPDEQAPRTQIK